ncbi:hypothetical protein ACIRP3_43005 [Streptomyces sp. NPDC101209]|uniref:hypothetical protein n=1 Tax=Streptomyces sp. NPDC101209 TaxID=3366129 RepID=UPI00381D9397
MKLPRIECQDCRRHIAVGPVAGRLGKCRMWRHDPPSSALVSCTGSLSIVDLPLPARQLELSELDDGLNAVPLLTGRHGADVGGIIKLS